MDKVDYLSLNVIWVIANAFVIAIYKTVLSSMLANSKLLKQGSTNISFLKDVDKTDARRVLAVIVFLFFTMQVIGKYNRDREKSALGLLISLLLGAAQLYFMCTMSF